MVFLHLEKNIYVSQVSCYTSTFFSEQNKDKFYEQIITVFLKIEF